MTRWLSQAAACALLVTLVRSAAADTTDGMLGAPCGSDADCVDALDCIPAKSGVPGGLCSTACKTREDCASVAPGAECAKLHLPGLLTFACIEPCQPDSWFGEGLDPNKCHGRSDMACIVSECVNASCSEAVAVCAPFCSTDQQCAEGLFCNKQTLLCTTKPPAGDPPGTVCDYQRPSCEAQCVVDQTATALSGVLTGGCVEFCVIGSPHACPGLTAGGLEQACLLYLGFQGAGHGDLGGCLGLCTCSSQCGDGFTCEPWDFGDERGLTGICAPVPFRDGASDCFADAPIAEPECRYGSERACKTEDCLGTATCRTDGTYGECSCLPPIEQSGGGGGPPDDDGEAGRVSGAGSGAEGGAGGAERGDMNASPPAGKHDSGCGCRLPARHDGASAVWLASLVAWALLVVRRAKLRRALAAR